MVKIVKKEGKMKKLTLGLGSLVAIAAPVSAVVACGSSESKEVKTQAQAQTSITVGKTLTPASIESKHSTIASFDANGVYKPGSAPATQGQIHAPNSIEAIAKANRDSGIASTGHYSILIHLLKGDELINTEALKVHQAFVKAYNSSKFTTHKLNDLDGAILKKALTDAANADANLNAKLDLTMFA